MRFEAVLFDLDGTLIDSAPDMARALAVVLRAQGLPPAPVDLVKRMIGDGSRTLVARAFTAAEVTLDEDALSRATAAYIDAYAAAPVVETRLYPEVLETLAALKSRGLKLAIATNKPKRLTGPVLDLLGLAAYFDVVRSRDEVSRQKPAPEHLWETLAPIAPTPDRALMVGDSENDVAAARAAAIRVVLVGHGYARRDPITLGADAVVDHIASLLAILEAW